MPSTCVVSTCGTRNMPCSMPAMPAVAAPVCVCGWQVPMEPSSAVAPSTASLKPRGPPPMAANCGPRVRGHTRERLELKKPACLLHSATVTGARSGGASAGGVAGSACCCVGCGRLGQPLWRAGRLLRILAAWRSKDSEVLASDLSSFVLDVLVLVLKVSTFNDRSIVRALRH